MRGVPGAARTVGRVRQGDAGGNATVRPRDDGMSEEDSPAGVSAFRGRTRSIDSDYACLIRLSFVHHAY